MESRNKELFSSSFYFDIFQVLKGRKKEQMWMWMSMKIWSGQDWSKQNC